MGSVFVSHCHAQCATPCAHPSAGDRQQRCAVGYVAKRGKMGAEEKKMGEGWGRKVRISAPRCQHRFWVGDTRPREANPSIKSWSLLSVAQRGYSVPAHGVGVGRIQHLCTRGRGRAARILPPSGQAVPPSLPRWPFASASHSRGELRTGTAVPSIPPPMHPAASWRALLVP